MPTMQWRNNSFEVPASAGERSVVTASAKMSNGLPCWAADRLKPGTPNENSRKMHLYNNSTCGFPGVLLAFLTMLRIVFVIVAFAAAALGAERTFDLLTQREGSVPPGWRSTMTGPG